IEPPARPPERRITRRIPPPTALPPELADEVARVADDELRESIATAARANLAWQKHVTEGPAAREATDRALHLPPAAPARPPTRTAASRAPADPQSRAPSRSREPGPARAPSSPARYPSGK